MPKRVAADARPGSGTQKVSRSVSGQAREKPAEDEMGEFEDAWEDEIEEDDDDAAQQGGDGTRV
jgi:ribosome assembly protein RRB1